MVENDSSPLKKMYFCQPNKNALNSYNYIFTLLNTIEIIIISFNILHFPVSGHD